MIGLSRDRDLPLAQCDKTVPSEGLHKGLLKKQLLHSIPEIADDWLQRHIRSNSKQQESASRQGGPTPQTC